jgi:outer membrane protein
LTALVLLAPPAVAQTTESPGSGFGDSVATFLDRYFWSKNVASVGFFYAITLDSSEPLSTTTTSLGLGTFTSPGTSSSVSDAVTPSFTFRHFFTENFAATFAAAVPPKFTVDSKGMIAPTVPGLGTLTLVDLGLPQNNPSITAREWAPAFLIHYFFGSESSRIRPFIGIGVTYNFFTDVKLNDNLENSLSDLGPLLQFGMGQQPTGKAKVDVDLSSSWQVVGNAGVQWEFIKNFVATGSVSFVPLSTTATITLRDDAGHKLSVNKADIKLNPLVFEFALGYKF